jgi:hypothetical protein
MVSAKARNILKNQWLTFNCYQFSRGVTAGRPRSRRWVAADKCVCTRASDKDFDDALLHTIFFREVSEEEETEARKQSEEYGGLSHEIGVLRNDGEAQVNVPSDFLDFLWAGAIAADGVLRSISLAVQRHENYWVISEVRLDEKMGEPFEVQYDKRSRPKISPPRDDPVVRELRAVRTQLKWRVWSGIAIIAVGVLVALWIANLWH